MLSYKGTLIQLESALQGKSIPVCVCVSAGGFYIYVCVFTCLCVKVVCGAARAKLLKSLQ